MQEKELDIIIERCRNGDTDAYGDLIDLYGKKIFNMVYKLIGDYHDSADLTQEVYIKIYKNISKFRGDSSFWSWLYTIIRNTCKDYFRKKYKENFEYIDKDNEDEKPLEIIDEKGFVEDLIIKKYEKDVITKSINLLNYSAKEIVILREIYGYTYSEIAAMLSISEGTVKSRLNRARDKLKNIIETMEQK